jgi:putative redox protein
MSQMIVKYLGELRTSSIHISSQNNIITDAPIDNQGRGEAFSPTDLVCSALASCMLTIMGIRARTHHFFLDGVEVKIKKNMQNSPRKISEINLEFHWPKSYSTDEQKILMEAALTCPVYLSLDPEIKKTIIWNF